MLTGVYLSTDSAVEAGDVALEWYMNKSFKSTATKVLHSVSGGLCRTRLMVDLLSGCHMMGNQLQPTCPASTHRGSCIAPDSDVTEPDSTLTEPADEEVDIGSMTLKEMCRLLRRSAGKSSRKVSSAVSSSTLLPEVGSDLGNKAAVSEASSPVDCAVQLESLQLHLDSSTSNSAESSDDVSPRGIATSCHKPIDIVVVKSESQAIEDCGQELTIKKRKSMTDPFGSESVISMEDDDCTLQMWRLCKRRMCGGKRPEGRGVERAHGMHEQVSCESSLTPAVVTLEVCSINFTPDITDLDKPFYSDSLCVSDGVPLLDSHNSRSDSLSCLTLGEGLKEDSSLKPSQDDIAADGLCNGEDYLNMKATVKEITTRENDESEQRHGPVISQTSLACLSEGSPHKTIASASPWALRACKVYNIASLDHSNVPDAYGVGQEGTIFHDKQDSDQSVRPVSGQVPDMEEPSTMACNTANVDSTGMEFTLPLQVIDKLASSNQPEFSSKPADNEVASFSRKMSTKEVFAIHRIEDSPPQHGKELDTVQESGRNAETACQPSDDDNSGSPMLLFPTERHNSEEEQELEQLKPSKIPCKRKAISPLSRERLLQASKFAEHDRASYGVDKRGLKKLPRAFKGFIGRDTFNHQRMDAYVKARSTVILESSPPEKPLLKEEVLPGSPCHNRKKFLPSKCFLPKSSLPSSYGDSVSATTVPSSSSLPSPSCVQKLSLVLNSSPSPPLQQNLKPNNGKSPTTLSPPMPTKGILRSSPPTCQGACKCEECESLRCRAEKAAEFSQRQMHDIEGLAVRLLKELNTMRCVVEETLIQRAAPRIDSPRSALSSEQVKRVTINALETEKMAKSWLVRMARDCNRYCKIMRMQERKLTFADESGGQLCHVKLFHSHAKGQPDPVLSNAAKENTTTPSDGIEDTGLPATAFEVASNKE